MYFVIFIRYYEPARYRVTIMPNAYNTTLSNQTAKSSNSIRNWNNDTMAVEWHSTMPLIHHTKKPKWPITYDLDSQQGSRGCQRTRSCKISSSCVQRFMSYHVGRKKTWRQCWKQYCPHFHGQEQVKMTQVTSNGSKWHGNNDRDTHARRSLSTVGGHTVANQPPHYCPLIHLHSSPPPGTV